MQRKVLIVDSDPVSCEMMRVLINSASLRAVVVTSLTAAKQVFSSSEPEQFLCAIVEYKLSDAPHGEAIDFAISAFLPTIVVVRQLDEEIRNRILEKNVVDYIAKENPQTYDYLNRLLTRLEKNRKVGVLVVDDSRVSRNKMQALLRRHNFVTYVANNGEQGLQVLAEQSDIKLVIVDENMPLMSGLEMLSELRKTHNKDALAVIGISSEKSTGLSARFIKSGANDYLHKPYCLEEFLCRIMNSVENLENIETIHRTANSDYLTGLPNRRHFFSRAIAMGENTNIDQCLAIIDIDHFKKINDNYGHDCGDHTLKQIAKLIAMHFSAYNTARFGGEEFCIHLPHVKLDEAHTLMENFRQAIAAKTIHFDGHSFNCQVSIGLCESTQEGIHDMLRRADENLYNAKKHGRNQVISQPL